MDLHSSCQDLWVFGYLTMENHGNHISQIWTNATEKCFMFTTWLKFLSDIFLGEMIPIDYFLGDMIKVYVFPKFESQNQRYCWWMKFCTSWYGEHPIIYRVLHIQGGAGFLPSTVSVRSWKILVLCFSRIQKKSGEMIPSLGGNFSEGRSFTTKTKT